MLAQVTGMPYEIAHAWVRAPDRAVASELDLPMRERRLDSGVRVLCSVPADRANSRILFEVATLDLLHSFFPYDGDPPLLPADGCLWLPPGRYEVHVHLWADQSGPQVTRRRTVEVPDYGLVETSIAFGVTAASK